jgi:hypothetical protein
MSAFTLNPIYENEVFRIGLDKNFSVLELSFLKHPDGEQFRNGYRLAFDAALNKNIRYWLTDATRIKSMERENQGWLMEKMTPLLKSQQLRRFAIVMAPECFVMTNPNQVYEKQSSGTEVQSSGLIKVHFDKEAAYNWIAGSMETAAV